MLSTPGWGYGLAASSLVGQSQGADDEGAAEAYGREITRVAVATDALGAVVVIAFAEPVVRLFVDDPSAPAVGIAVPLVYAAALAVIAQGVNRTRPAATTDYSSRPRANVASVAPSNATFFRRWIICCWRCSGSSRFQKSCITGVTLTKKVAAAAAAARGYRQKAMPTPPDRSGPLTAGTGISGNGAPFERA